MPTDFLHGVETLTVENGSRPITVVKSAVIGLIGFAPTGTANTPTLCSSEKEDAVFGKQIAGFSIPQALSDIRAQGAGSIIVINCFDAATMLVQVTAEAHTVALGKVKTTYPPIASLVVVGLDRATPPADVTHVLGTDYSVDAFGNITTIGTAIAEGAALRISYKKLDPATLTAAAILGAIDGVTNVRTGMKTLELCRNKFGFNPKLLICPGFDTLTSVSAALIAAAVKYRAFTLINAPSATTVPGAITGRGPAGAITFNTSSKRAILCFPWLKGYDPQTGTDIARPYSPYVAGVIAATDLNEGFHVSPSNKEILGITGVTLEISAALNDATTEANRLNAAGILTVFNSYGTGVRVWGNRSAAFPSSTHPSNFICVQRTADVVDESVENAMMQFIDKPIGNALIDSVRESVNSFIRTLIARGALLQGSKCSFNKNENSAEEMAAGHLTFTNTLMPPTPGERFTFNIFIDINLLKNLL